MCHVAKIYIPEKYREFWDNHYVQLFKICHNNKQLSSYVQTIKQRS